MGRECRAFNHDSRAFGQTVDIEPLFVLCAIMLVLVAVIPQAYKTNHREFPGASGASAMVDMSGMNEYGG